MPRRRLELEAEQLLHAHGVTDIAPGALVENLPLGMRQRVEIVRALWRHPTLLLLDEATAALADREWLFGLIDRTLKEGTSILYISHKIDEIRRLCQRCVILRNGMKVLESEVAAMSDEAIFASMAGRGHTGAIADHTSWIKKGATPRLKISGLRGEGIDDISFDLAPGEILGVAGLEGHGQSNLFKALVGLWPLQAGQFAVDGRTAVIRSPPAPASTALYSFPKSARAKPCSIASPPRPTFLSPSSTRPAPFIFSAKPPNAAW